MKGVATASKTCYLYIVDRQTGKPINPIIETVVPTTSDLRGSVTDAAELSPRTFCTCPRELSSHGRTTGSDEWSLFRRS